MTQQLQEVDIGAVHSRSHGPAPTQHYDISNEDHATENELSIASALQRMIAAADDPESISSWALRAMAISPSDDDAAKDFTACSGDDCGWCGHCTY